MKNKVNKGTLCQCGSIARLKGKCHRCYQQKYRKNHLFKGLDYNTYMKQYYHNRKKVIN